MPRFCVRHGNRYEALDYFRHLISCVAVEGFDYAAVDWDVSVALASAADSFYRLTLGQDSIEHIEERETTSLETDEQVKSWLVGSLPFEHFSHKQLRAIVDRAGACLYAATPQLGGKLGMVKFQARDKLVGLVERETDRQTQEAFAKLHQDNRLYFYLDCVEGCFEIPQRVPVRTTRKLVHDNNDLVQRSLFDWVPDDLNDYEKSVALYLDNHPQVLWWYRNLVGSHNFSIQGYTNKSLI